MTLRGLTLTAGLLAGCAAPGTPPLVRSGPEAIPFCQTIPETAQARPFEDRFYLTTWGSAYREGAAAGVRDGLDDGSAIGRMLLAQLQLTTRYKGRDLIPVQYDADPFCMRFSASKAQVQRATARAFEELRIRGFQPTASRGEVPTFETNFVERAHRSAKWLEKFVAAVEDLGDGTTIVAVSRQVFIARDDSGYYQGNSVGQNEAALLTRIRDLLS